MPPDATHIKIQISEGVVFVVPSRLLNICEDLFVLVLKIQFSYSNYLQYLEIIFLSWDISVIKTEMFI